MSDWRAAACIGHDSELWFSKDPLEQAEAKRICQGCPLIQACLERALNDEGAVSEYSRHGILGGLTPTQRARTRRPPTVPPCGTGAGYRRHYRLGEPKCLACIEANSALRRARKAMAA